MTASDSSWHKWTCPACGSEDRASVLFGEPAASPALEADLASGRVVLGGCIVDGDARPQSACRTCGAHCIEGTVVGFRALSGRPLSIKARLEPPTNCTEHLVGRLILTGDAGSAKTGRRSVAARRWLLDLAFRALHEAGVTVTYLVTPAGFIKGHVPIGVRSSGWRTDPDDFEALARPSEAAVRELLDDETKALARRVVAFLVVGVDLYTSGGPEPHGELAVVYDVAAGFAVKVTGKSYPTTRQERVLIRNQKVSNHLVDVGGHQVAVLVCHDLMAFGGRSARNRGKLRETVAHDLQNAVRESDVALHLPHTVSTDSWTDPWRQFRAQHPGLAGWGSAILYRTTGDQGRPTTPPSDALLAATGAGSSGSLAIEIGDA